MSLFITFEGIEGAGKTTQIKLLKKAFQKKGNKVVVTREPGGTAISNQIRRILLKRENKKMVPLCELFLYEASRVQHVTETILPNLRKGAIVISDRYADATTVYQGIARGISLKWVSRLNSLATHHLKPNLTIILDCPVEKGIRRTKKRGTTHLDRFEREKTKFHHNIRRAYLALAKKEPKRVKIVDGTKTPKEVHKDILHLVEHRYE